MPPSLPPSLDRAQPSKKQKRKWADTYRWNCYSTPLFFQCHGHGSFCLVTIFCSADLHLPFSIFRLIFIPCIWHFVRKVLLLQDEVRSVHPQERVKRQLHDLYRTGPSGLTTAHLPRGSSSFCQGKEREAIKEKKVKITYSASWRTEEESYDSLLHRLQLDAGILRCIKSCQTSCRRPPPKRRTLPSARLPCSSAASLQRIGPPSPFGRGICRATPAPSARRRLPTSASLARPRE